MWTGPRRGPWTRAAGAMLLGLAAVLVGPVSRAEGGPEDDYLALKPLVVNVRDGAQERFLQVTTELKLASPAGGELVRRHLAPVRDSLILLLSDQDAATLLRTADREALRQQALAAVQATLQTQTGEDPVQGLYFTGFVIQ